MNNKVKFLSFYQSLVELDYKNTTEHKGLKVYLNNYVYSLTEELLVKYPIFEKLVGADNFKAITFDYIKKHPSDSRDFEDYGLLFNEFVEAKAVVDNDFFFYKYIVDLDLMYYLKNDNLIVQFPCFVFKQWSQLKGLIFEYGSADEDVVPIVWDVKVENLRLRL